MLGKTKFEFLFFFSIIQNAQSENNGSNFFCQHGPAECSGNRLQSCVLDALGNDQDAIVTFVTCQMKNNAEYTGEKVRRSRQLSSFHFTELIQLFFFLIVR